MEVLAAVSSWVISSACNVQVGGNHWLRSMCGPGNQSIAALMSKLSEQAEVHFPGESTYKGATDRWSTLKAPNPTFVVVPATENDVAESVKFANSLTLPYLAVNSGHGAIITQGRMKYGMEIWMDKLKTIKINPDGKTATIGGGARSKAVTDTLWAAKKQTVTGGCECTSILGPGLGGGHGFLQGRHGLIADQFVSMNIVNADGELKTVSQKSDPDMWWALQGAGHSFAIVTSVTSKIYNITHFDWAYQSFMFTGDKVKGLYQNINDYLLKNGSQSVDMMNYSFFFSNPAVDPNKASLFCAK
ncbi:hypothetical protein QQS21_008971 [Conoideocrella luteorostrata]|uniref:FAD-binding PCMH-type domain-containing protein n=1 Tax=Conoideocrella luteorostrata TaxID=1105319 RepID=A0AAJ0CK68_9HYPO|nr:hypothetical protein QQS21_008971 [Conoideocrella luteorostrata]